MIIEDPIAVLQTCSPSRCFDSFNSLFDLPVLDPYDSFVLGFSLATHGIQNLQPILEIVTKIASTKKHYMIPQGKLRVLHHLVLESNFDLVCVLFGIRAPIKKI